MPIDNDELCSEEEIQEEQRKKNFERVQQLEASLFPSKKRRVARGYAARTVVQKAQMGLFELEKSGRFASVPATPSNEFPSILARIPIFLPTTRERQKELLDDDNAVRFESSWGAGRRYGPNLSIYDEDTLLAIFGLRQRYLTGLPHNLPIPVSGIPFRGMESYQQDEVGVFTVHTTVGEINAFLKKSKGGRSYQRRLESVKRLSGTKLEFERCSDKQVVRGISTSLLELAWEQFEDDGVLFIEIAPLIAYWLNEAYSYIDLNIRSQLSDAGKAIHRFLSSEQRIDIFEDKLRQCIGYSRPRKEFMRDLRNTMETLEQLGWCEFEILGTGRTQPFKLSFRRTRKQSSS